MAATIILPEQLEELRNQKVWINHVLIWNPSKHGGEGGYDKPPVNPYTLGNGSSTDASMWTTFDEAVSQIGKEARVFYQRTKQFVISEVAGVGLILEAAGLVGFDFDGVIRIVNGERRAYKEAVEIWTYLDTYTEMSPSGTGVHALAKGRKPSGSVSKIKNKWKLSDGTVADIEYEVYDSGRYFTFTGDPVKGCEKGLEDRQEQIDKVCRLYDIRKEKENAAKAQSSSSVVSCPTGGTGETVTSGESDSELWEKMFRSRYGSEIRRLYDGDLTVRGGDHSACDLALCNHLAYWTNCDESRIDRMFRQTGLVRTKWIRDYVIPKYGKTYRDWTISTAVSDKSAYRAYTPEEKKAYAQKKEAEELAKWEKEHPNATKLQRAVERAHIWSRYDKRENE